MDVRYALIGALVLPAGAWALSPRVGLDLGVTLGGSGGVSERVSLGVTGSASATPGRSAYETYTTATVGAFGDVRLAFDGSYRLTAGALGGVTKGGNCDGFPIAGLGEVGVSLLHGGRPALHLGASAWLPIVQLRTFGALRSPSVAARESGVRLHGDRSIRSPGITVAGGPSIAFDGGCVMVGRPARDAEGRILLPEACGDDPAWLETARGEHSAVASFVDLANRLHALGAPGDLVGRVLHAAAEEAGHAVMAYLRAGTRTVAPLVLPHRPVAHRRAELARIAHEALHDGVINEGASVVHEAARRDATRDDDEARHIDVVVREELTHIRVNEDVLRWARRELRAA